MNMNRTVKFIAILALFGMVTVGLLKINQKMNNPEPTAYDLEIRKRFVEEQYLLIHCNGFKEFSNTTGISLEQKEEIAAHLWITDSPPKFNASAYQTRFIEIIWGYPMGERITIDGNWVDARYTYSDRNKSPIFKTLHPATIRFLRRWIEDHCRREE